MANGGSPTVDKLHKQLKRLLGSGSISDPNTKELLADYLAKIEGGEIDHDASTEFLSRMEEQIQRAKLPAEGASTNVSSSVRSVAPSVSLSANTMGGQGAKLSDLVKGTGIPGDALDSFVTGKVQGAETADRLMDELGDLLSIEGKGGATASKAAWNAMREAKNPALLMGYLDKVLQTPHTLSPEIWKVLQGNIEKIKTGVASGEVTTLHNSVFFNVPPQEQEKVRAQLNKALLGGIKDGRFTDAKGGTSYLYSLPEGIKDIEVDGQKLKKALKEQTKLVEKRAEVIANKKQPPLPTDKPLATKVDDAVTKPGKYSLSNILKGAKNFALGGEEGAAAWAGGQGIKGIARAFLGTPAGLLSLAMIPALAKDTNGDQFKLAEAAQPTGVERATQGLAQRVNLRRAYEDASRDPAAMASLQMQASLMDKMEQGPRQEPGRIQFDTGG